MKSESEIKARMEDRARKVMENASEEIQYGVIRASDPDADKKTMEGLQSVYSDLRALLRVPPGDQIQKHYERLYNLARPQ